CTRAQHALPAPTLSSPRLITYFWALRHPGALKIRASTIQNRQAMDSRDPRELALCVAFSVRDRFGIIVLRIRLSRVPFGERANTILENAARDLADRSPTFLGKALDCLEGIPINTGCDPLSPP